MPFCTLYNDAGLSEVQASFSTLAGRSSKPTRLENSTSDTSETLSYGSMYELPFPLIFFGKQFAAEAHRLSMSRDGLHNNSGLATLAIIVAGLCVGILQKKVEEGTVTHKDDYNHSTMSIQKHFTPCITYKLILISTIIFCLWWRRIFYISNPKPFASIFKLAYVQKAVLLILYLGSVPVSALPGHDTLQTDLYIDLSARQSSTVWTIQLKGWPNTGYCARMHFGSNSQQTFCMLVDTGSSNTAVAATADSALGDYEFYDMSLSGEDFINVGKSVKVTYSSGEWSGYLVRDKVGFGDYSMETCAFSLITSSTDFFIEGAEWVGILGMAYKSLAKPDSTVGTVWDSVRESNGLKDVFSLQLCPPKESTLFPGTFNRQGGYMTLGGTNSSLYSVGKGVFYTRIVEERFFSVLLTKIAVEDKTINMSCKEFNNDKTIVDSGTTDIFFPTEVFQEVKNTFANYFKGGLPIDVPDEFWIGEQKLLWQAAHVEEIYQSFPTLYLSLATADDNSQEFCLAVVPQLYLRQIDVQAGEADSAVCPTTSPCDAFTFGVKPRDLGTVIGGNAMLGYYTVFDRENKRIGFAESTCDYRSSKTTPYISGPYAREPEDCQMPVPVNPWNIVTYFCGALTTFFAAVMLTLIVCVRVVRHTNCKYFRKVPLLKSGETEPKMYCGSTRLTCGVTICCVKSQNHIDEGYVSEINTCNTSFHEDNDDPTTTPTTPDTDQDNHIVPTISLPTHAMIVCSQAITQSETQQTNINDAAEGKEETNRTGTEEERVKTAKKKKRRKRKKHHPVMETETPGRDALCVAPVSPNQKILPGTALVRAGNTTMSRLAIITDEYTGETHFLQMKPRTFIPS